MTAETSRDPRLGELVDGIVRLAAGDHSVRLHSSPARDEVDAVMIGVNILAKDLAASYSELEERVATRTAELVAAQAELERAALTDSLTSLSNRVAFTRVLGHTLEAAMAGEPAPALLILDLDSFKGVNDSMGHAAGDELLRLTAGRLLGCVRSGDTVARLGGDEFAVLLPHSTEDRARSVASRILESMREPFDLDGRRASCGTSIGIRVAEAGQSAEDVILHADIAMYAAKAQKGSSVKIFEPVMLYARELETLATTELQSAIAEGQLVLHYQPVVELASGALEGVEALVRWAHPARGLLMPDQFIGLAESTGLIEEVGRWVLREGTRQLQAWRESGLTAPGFSLRVNISSTELQSLQLIDIVRDALLASGTDPSELILEITESSAVAGGEVDQYSLLGLHKLGVRLEIDDFGTGYSAISYLQKLPVNVVKMDRSLIEDLNPCSAQGPFVAAILDLIHACGMRALAEGIESPEQVRTLRELGCESGQGYYFSRPVPAAAFEDLVRGWPAGA